MHLKNPQGTKTIILQDHETLEIFLEDVSPGSRIFSLEVILLGQNAQCHITGRIKTTGSEEKKWTIQQYFKGLSQSGSLDIRGIAEGKSHILCDGVAVLEKESRMASAKIQEKIMLFDEAKAQLLPILTVKTNLVESASHSASVAPVNPDIFLYLASRGIAKTDAEILIKDGFLKNAKDSHVYDGPKERSERNTKVCVTPAPSGI